MGLTSHNPLRLVHLHLYRHHDLLKLTKLTYPMVVVRHKILTKGPEKVQKLVKIEETAFLQTIKEIRLKKETKIIIEVAKAVDFQNW